MPTCVAPPVKICKYTPPGGERRQSRAHPYGLTRIKLSEQDCGRKEVRPTNYSLVENTVAERAIAGRDYCSALLAGCNSMWRLALGTILSLLPRRWRAALRLQEALPWARSTGFS